MTCGLFGYNFAVSEEDKRLLERLKELSEVEVLKGKKDCLIKKVKRL